MAKIAKKIEVFFTKLERTYSVISIYILIALYGQNDYTVHR